MRKLNERKILKQLDELKKMVMVGESVKKLNKDVKRKWGRQELTQYDHDLIDVYNDYLIKQNNLERNLGATVNIKIMNLNKSIKDYKDDIDDLRDEHYNQRNNVLMYLKNLLVSEDLDEIESLLTFNRDF